MPSPGYSSTNAELAAEWYDWDNYDFWSDLAYGSDSYFDPESKVHYSKRGTASKLGHDTHKRKRITVSAGVTKDKRRRVTLTQHKALHDHGQVTDNVVFRADQPVQAAPPTPKSMESFSLLPDWRQRFPADADVSWQSSMPEAMRKAAEASEEELQDPDASTTQEQDDEASPLVEQKTVVRSRKHQAHHVNTEAAVEAEDEAEFMPPSLDPETLRLILRQKLGDTGIDEDAFMAGIQNLLTGGAADDVAEQLTKILLQNDGDGSSSALSWLSKQGVNIDADEEEEAQAENADEAASRRVDSGAGLPNDVGKPASARRKRKSKADPGSSSVEVSPTKDRPVTRSARKKTKS